MAKFYSASTGGFYYEEWHGSRQMSVIDPAWTRPTIEVENPDPDGPPTITVPDESAVPATLLVPNPDCKIPADAVEITDAEHAAILAEQSAGKRIEADADGRPVAVDPPAPSLADVKKAASDAIDAEAGNARARHLTICSGQDATYLLKAADADKYKADGYPAAQIASYPWVKAKAAALVATPAAADYQAAADLIIATRDSWVAIGASIEQARETGKRLVGEAATPADVDAAKAAAIAALGSL